MSALPHALPSDEELARRAGVGDAEEFEELYRRYARPLTAYAARTLRDSSAAEDVAQSALLNAYQALRRGSVPENTRAWLYRATRNAALDAIERRGEIVELDEEQGGGSEDPVDARAARDDLLAAVRTLPERQRDVFVLRELRGLRVGEIADALDLAVEQVEQALFAARNRLAEQLVYGERLNCASVQSLDRARLSRAERRAVKSHVRACPSCRSAPASLRVGAVTSALELVRNAVALLLTGGGAAKTAAVVAAAAAVGATPMVAREHVRHTPAATEASGPTVARRVTDVRAEPTLAARFLGSATPAAVPAAALRLPPRSPQRPTTPQAHDAVEVVRAPHRSLPEVAGDVDAPAPAPVDVPSAQEPAYTQVPEPESQPEPAPVPAPLEDPAPIEQPSNTNEERIDATPVENDHVADEPVEQEPIAEPVRADSVQTDIATSDDALSKPNANDADAVEGNAP